VRKLLSAEIGTRAAEGHIGRVNRWFAGTQYIDEVESLCVELLKRAFRCRYVDQRLMGSMLGNMAVYHALTEPGDTIMAAPQPFGGYSSNRLDGPAGMRGLRIVDVPFDPLELDVDLASFTQLARREKPKLVAMGKSMTLFPLGLMKTDMDTIAGFFERVLIDGEEPDSVRKDVEDFRLPLQKFYYCFDNGWPPLMVGKKRGTP
jgi:glycine hydroxymethyltransferase